MPTTKSKQESGVTYIEVVLAIFIIALIVLVINNLPSLWYRLAVVIMNLLPKI